MYVGLTRAKDQVYLVYTFRRLMWGYNDISNPSRFLSDIPPEITIGLAKIPQPPADSPNYQKRWDTSWEPKRKVVYYDFEQKAKPKAARPKPSTSAKRFQSGQRVQHKVFGEGVVIKSVILDEIEEVEVLFQQSGTKNLDASFLQSFDGKG
jgi:DNA helicase-2/ATP-dependent DNA helicase PcrA